MTTTPDTEQPIDAWLKEYVTCWQERLQLWNARIRLRIRQKDDEYPGKMATCIQDPNILEYDITFGSDITNNEEWRVVVIHEMLHVLLARTDQVVDKILVPQIADYQARTMAWDIYTIQIEQAVHQLALSWYEATKRLDFPDEETV
jgi:hypothetical protein